MSPKIPKKYCCEICTYNTSNKKDFNKHLSTRKHQILTNTNKKSPKVESKYTCDCGRTYKHVSSLYTHRKKCDVIHNTSIVTDDKQPDEDPENSYKDMVVKMMKENDELRALMKEQQQQISELIPRVGNNTHNRFNINVFLNERCKDAIPLMEFVNNLELHTSDLTITGEHGFARGISNIFLRALNATDITKRPIHCSDIKRETLYIKNNCEWTKDTNKTLFTNAIDTVKHNNFMQLQAWIERHPGCDMRDSIHHTEYMNIIQNCFGGTDDKTKQDNIKKTISNIAEHVLVS